MVTKWRRKLPVLIYVTLIFAVSSVPALSSPGPEFILKDKIAHFIAYFVLGGLLWRSLGRRVSDFRWGTFGFLVAVAATIGAVNEIFQSYIPGRFMSIGDWYADVAGAAVGVWVLVFVGTGDRRAPRSRKGQAADKGDKT